MKTIMIFWLLLGLNLCAVALAQANHPGAAVHFSRAILLGSWRQQPGGSGSDALDAEKERQALQILIAGVKKNIVSAATAMPADKYGFAPSSGEFKGVRSFGQQLKHLAATNYMLAAAALDAAPPADAGDEMGPETVRTKAEILDYVNGSFEQLQKADAAIGKRSLKVKASPISPLPEGVATRSALIFEALIHAFDHYGQMVEYLRLNGVVPPASRP